MKNKILIFLLIGIIFCYLLPRPIEEVVLELPQAPRTVLIHKTNVYVSPVGKVLKIAQKVAKATKVPCDTISRIMYYESGYDSLSINVNRNKTKDVGLFQINSIWNSTALKMGLDLRDPDDNAEFAIYLIKKNGLRDWSASMKHWKIYSSIS